MKNGELQAGRGCAWSGAQSQTLRARHSSRVCEAQLQPMQAPGVHFSRGIQEAERAQQAGWFIQGPQPAAPRSRARLRALEQPFQDVEPPAARRNVQRRLQRALRQGGVHVGAQLHKQGNRLNVGGALRCGEALRHGRCASACARPNHPVHRAQSLCMTCSCVFLCEFGARWCMEQPALTFMSASANGVRFLLLCTSTGAPSATSREMESHCPASAARWRAAGRGGGEVKASGGTLRSRLAPARGQHSATYCRWSSGVQQQPGRLGWQGGAAGMPALGSSVRQLKGRASPRRPPAAPPV